MAIKSSSLHDFHSLERISVGFLIEGGPAVAAKMNGKVHSTLVFLLETLDVVGTRDYLKSSIRDEEIGCIGTARHFAALEAMTNSLV